MSSPQTAREDEDGQGLALRRSTRGPRGTPALPRVRARGEPGSPSPWSAAPGDPCPAPAAPLPVTGRPRPHAGRPARPELSGLAARRHVRVEEPARN